MLHRHFATDSPWQRAKGFATPSITFVLAATFIFGALPHRCVAAAFTHRESHIIATRQVQSPARSDRDQARELLRQGKIADALPYLERAAKAAPEDGETMFYLGYARVAAATGDKDEASRRRARLQARDELQRAKRLGYSSPLLDNTLASIPPDGSTPARFSANPKIEAAMTAGEAAFSRGDFDAARKAYQTALDLDPAQYFAALFIGDSYFKEGTPKTTSDKAMLFAQAGEWYARAIKINPEIETAYRYWGSALMDGGKMDEALDKVIEAYIVMPYERMSAQGLLRWAQMNRLSQLAHPRIEIPTSVSRQGTSTTIKIDPNSLGKEVTDGSNHWLMYSISRAAYPQGSFAKDHPSEKNYRHSLAEEASALRMVAEAAGKDVRAGKIKQLDSSLANLVKLHDEGLIEAYVLLARPDEGIAQDYVAYRQKNADKLRRYVRQYIMQRGN